MEQINYFPNWINRLLVLLQKKEWRGKHKFYVWLSKHFSHKVITHQVGERSFSVPLDEWCFWLEKGPENYYLDEFLPFCEVINNLEQPFTLFDLGADIGTVSSLVASHCQRLEGILAFEPNPRSYQLLQSNLANINILSQCAEVAISNYQGKASFHVNSARLNDHEGYIKQNSQGDTLVTSLDHWLETETAFALQELIVLKVDVEGQEAALLEGAKRSIQQAKHVVILIEIHPQVLARSQQCPEDLFAAAEQARRFNWIVPLLQNKSIDRNQNFYAQVPSGQYDIIGISSEL